MKKNAMLGLLLLLLLLLIIPFMGTLINSLECTRKFQIEDLKFTDSPYINRYWHCDEDASADIFPSIGEKRETWMAFDTTSESSKYYGYPRKVLQEVAHEECYAANADARHAIPIHNMDSAGTGTGTGTDADADANDDTAKRIAGALRGDVFDFSAHMRQLCAVHGFRGPFTDFCRESKSMCGIPSTAECLDFLFAAPDTDTDTDTDPTTNTDEDKIQNPCAHLFDSIEVRDKFFEWRRAERNATKYAYSGMCFFNRFFICRAHSHDHHHYHGRIPAVLLPYTLHGEYVYEFAPPFDPTQNAIAFRVEFVDTHTNTNTKPNANRRLMALPELEVDDDPNKAANINSGCQLYLVNPDANGVYVSLFEQTYEIWCGTSTVYVTKFVSGPKHFKQRSESWSTNLVNREEYSLQFQWAPGTGTGTGTGTMSVYAESQMLSFAFTGLFPKFRIVAALCKGKGRPQLSTTPLTPVHAATEYPSLAPTGPPSSAPTEHPFETTTTLPTRSPSASPVAVPGGGGGGGGGAATLEWQLYFPATQGGFGNIDITPTPPSCYWEGEMNSGSMEYPYFRLHDLSFTAGGTESVTLAFVKGQSSTGNKCFIHFDNTDNPDVLSAWSSDGVDGRALLRPVVHYYQLYIGDTYAQLSDLPYYGQLGFYIDYSGDMGSDHRVSLVWDGNANSTTISIETFDGPSSGTYSQDPVVFLNMTTPFQLLVSCSDETTTTVVV